MRNITTHHDGHGLNDIIAIRADDRDREKGGNASHTYRAQMIIRHEDADTEQIDVAHIQFQHGPRKLNDSKPGVTEAVLLAILIDRLEGFQEGPFACVENGTQLVLLRLALDITRERADKRAAQGVLGENKPHES